MCCRPSLSCLCTPRWLASEDGGRGAGHHTGRSLGAGRRSHDWGELRTRPRTQGAETCDIEEQVIMMVTTDRLLVLVTLLHQRPPAQPHRVIVGLGSLHNSASLHKHVLALLLLGV